MNHNMNTHTTGRMVTNSWLVALLAIAELVLGFVLLSFPYIMGASAVWVAGFVLLVVALMRFIQVFTRPGYRIWNILATLIYACLGITFIMRTEGSLSVITLVIGIALLVGGVLRLAVAFSLRSESGSAWRFFNSVISIVLGAFVTWSWPESSVWLLGTVIAVEMIFSGWTLLFLALAPRREELPHHS